MPTYEGSIAAATAVVGYNLAQGEPWASVGRHRVLVACALLGSAAAGDTIVAAKIGETRVAQLYNRTTGFPNRDDFVDVNELIPAGEAVTLPVIDAPATNAINYYVTIEDL